MDNERLEVFENEFFRINKRLQMMTGLWPYAPTKHKYFRRFVVITLFIILLLPNINGTIIWCSKDLNGCAENVSAVFIISGMLVKYGVTILSEKKIKEVYFLVANNWITISDANEQQILRNYAILGKKLTIGYIVFVSIGTAAFTQIAIMPSVLDIIFPLNESRPKILVVNAEYFNYDPYEYYYELHLMYSVVSPITVILVTGVDTTYAVVVNQSLGFLSIVKYRLHKATNYSKNEKNLVYDRIILAIRLHKDALQFMNIIESSYKICFLFLIISSVLCLSIGSIVFLEHRYELLDFTRRSILMLGLYLHIFYITWPGQKVLDHSDDLFIQTYRIKWYNVSEKEKTLIKIMMLRCSKPCVFTAGGLSNLNFENTGKIFKTSISYITIAISFRE